MNKTTVGTFSPNRTEPIHSWYPYIEGYSSRLVERELDTLSLEKGALIYDPFAGTGTTPLASCMRGFVGLYSETNPFMRFVIETKTNTVRNIITNQMSLLSIKTIEQDLRKSINQKDITENTEFTVPFARYFDDLTLISILKIKNAISKIENTDLQNIARLALSSILVPVSKMIRRGDLRFAREQELKKKRRDINEVFFEKIHAMINDLLEYGNQLKGSSICLASDVRDIEICEEVDCIITSPPYLNGTNYIRNTKLELFLNDFVSEDYGLSDLHSKGIVAGINNVSKKTARKTMPDAAIKYYESLLPIAYDKRIPVMVASYFADMNKSLQKMSKALKKGSVLIMDIGDSQFAGIHIPTHDILATIAADHGLCLIDSEVLRSRKSKNGMTLSQCILRFVRED